MGYYIKSKKIVLSLDLAQQEEIIKIWKELNHSQKNITFVEILAEQYSYIDCEENKKRNKLKITKIEGKLRSNNIEFWQNIAHIITPGNYISWRGEDGAFFGSFFNGIIEHYESYKELAELQEKFNLNKKLSKELPKKEFSTKHKI